MEDVTMIFRMLLRNEVSWHVYPEIRISCRAGRDVCGQECWGRALSRKRRIIAAYFEEDPYPRLLGFRRSPEYERMLALPTHPQKALLIGSSGLGSEPRRFGRLETLRFSCTIPHLHFERIDHISWDIPVVKARLWYKQDLILNEEWRLESGKRFYPLGDPRQPLFPICHPYQAKALELIWYVAAERSVPAVVSIHGCGLKVFSRPFLDGAVIYNNRFNTYTHWQGRIVDRYVHDAIPSPRTQKICTVNKRSYLFGS